MKYVHKSEISLVRPQKNIAYWNEAMWHIPKLY